MNINNLIKNINKENLILKDEDDFWYFDKNQKETIINYLKKCSYQDLAWAIPLSERYAFPIWYKLLNDHEIVKVLTEQSYFKELIELKKEDYHLDKKLGTQEIVVNIKETNYFTPNIDIMKMLKMAGLSFNNRMFLIIDNPLLMAKILQEKIIDFDEKSLLQNPYEMNKYDSLLQKILFDYKGNESNKDKLLIMAKSIELFISLGCEKVISYKCLESASTIFESEKNNYSLIIKKYCPELNNLIERLNLEKKLNEKSLLKEKKTKI